MMMVLADNGGYHVNDLLQGEIESEHHDGEDNHDDNDDENTDYDENTDDYDNTGDDGEVYHVNDLLKGETKNWAPWGWG